MRHAYRAEDDEQFGTAFPQLRKIVASEHAYLPDGQLAELVEDVFGNTTAAEDLENFFQQVGQVAKRALPGVVSGATTGAVAGPWGALIGGVAGGALSAAQGAGGPSGGVRRRRPRRAQGKGQQRPQRLRAAQPATPGAAMPAAQALLQLVNNPQLSQALTAMLMGNAGARSLPVASTPVPVGAMTNLVGVLANQASAEYHQLVAGESASTPSYLLDEQGEYVCDPADPVQRAEVLLALLEDEEQQQAAEPVLFDPFAVEPPPARPSRADQHQAFYDDVDEIEAFYISLGTGA